MGGPTGTGKTALSGALMRTFYEQGWEPWKFDLATLVNRLSAAKFGQEKQGIIRICERVHLLVLDEVEPQPTTWIDPTLRMLINYRYERSNLATVLITNLVPDVLTDYLGQKIYRRLLEGGGYIGCDWEMIEPLARANARGSFQGVGARG